MINNLVVYKMTFQFLLMNKLSLYDVYFQRHEFQEMLVYLNLN